MLAPLSTLPTKVTVVLVILMTGVISLQMAKSVVGDANEYVVPSR